MVHWGILNSISSTYLSPLVSLVDGDGRERVKTLCIVFRIIGCEVKGTVSSLTVCMGACEFRMSKPTYTKGSFIFVGAVMG